MRWPFFNHIQLLRLAGLFTYLCVGVPLLQIGWFSHRLADLGRPSTRALWLWAACYLIFGIIYWLLTRRMGPRRHRLVKLLGLLVMTATAMGVGYFSQSGLAALLLVVTAVVLPWLLPLRLAIVALLGQYVLLVPLFATFPTLDTLALAVFQALLYLGISVLTFVTAVIARQQAEARDEQRQLNAELRATRALLAESSRIAERIRIARELHDLLGHHLTALSLNLEVTSHLVNGRAAEHVEVAQDIAKRLLGDVREAVSELREDDAMDLRAALHELAAGVPGLDVRLKLPPRFTVQDPRRAEVVLRCAQEIITNAVRHARAEHLWVRFERTPEGELWLEARDDGCGSENLRPGNGITGMRERLAEFGGRLTITTATNRGFALDAWLPLEPSYA
ncbi:MAG TPA: sensor histidine kinase [Rhodanobacteraceae bacterium]|nr:sensor histidine kinase [Rhodanobacteraceae bacterium]